MGFFCDVAQAKFHWIKHFQRGTDQRYDTGLTCPEPENGQLMSPI